MKAIILAAGRGSRMGNMTDEQPKCFVKMQGKRLLDWQLDALRENHIDEIAIVRGYRAECFTEPIRYFNNLRWAQTNMVASLVCAAEWLANDDCIVSYADIFYPPSTLVPLIACDADIVITYDPAWLKLWAKRFEDPLSDAETFKLKADGTLAEIGKKPTSLDQIEGQYMGLLKFKPQGWQKVQALLAEPGIDADRLDMTSLLNHLIQRDVAIHAIPITERWGEIDSQSDLASVAD